MAEQDIVKLVNDYGETHVKVSAFSYTWIIKNFKHCYRKVSQFITSPTFITKNNEETEFKWQLRLYPSGVANYPGNVSLELVLVSAPSIAQDAYIEFSAINNEGVKKVKKSVFVTIAANLEQYKVYNVFETQDDIQRNYLLNNNLIIKCEIYFNKGVTEYAGHNSIQILHDLTASDHRLKEFNDFEHILKVGKFSDATIIVGSKKFRVHKAILAARSRVFAAMFEHEMKEKNADTIEIGDGIRPEVMQEVLHFIYNAKVNDIQNLASDLLYAAEKYMLDGLKIMCEEVLADKISIENIGEILVLIDQIQTEKLQSVAMDFIKVNARQLIKTEQFNAAMKMLSKDFMCILIENVSV